YMVYFELSQDNKFALITQQILKPLAHFNHGDVSFFLASASIVKKELAFTRNWLEQLWSMSSINNCILRRIHLKL
ncbi:hypothetical protein ACW7EJ_16820, partial [Acinetobacter soli]